ncbi:recombinase family protein [Nonomuraea sp. NPDC050547]|uniref:recombinase family protein n=1 Tax=Nonomuraea sp. NPDC050547 TaxID=3364368 RepID=UPI0037A90F13
MRLLAAATQGRAVVDYCRISYDKTGAADGVGDQHDENEEAAEQLGETISRSYVDNDLSAFKANVQRPDYDQLLADMRDNLIRLVIIWHANRLNRTVEAASAFIEIARAAKVKLYSVTKGSFYNLETAAGRRDLIKDTLDAEYESAHRGERVEKARKRQAKHGIYGGGVRPYGWGVDTGRVRSVCANPQAPLEDRRYEDRTVLDMGQHNPIEAAEIRRWALDLLAGVKMGHVLRGMAKRGVRSASQADGRTLRRGGKDVEPGGWQSRTVWQILLNPRTAGHSVRHGEIIKRNAYPYILTDAQQEALRVIKNDPARTTSPGNVPRWLTSLIAICDKCGATYRARSKNGKLIYQCITGHNGPDAILADMFVRDHVLGRLSHADVQDLLPDAQAETVDFAAIQAQIIELEESKRHAARMFVEKIFDEDMVIEAKRHADEQIAGLREQMNRATTNSPLSDLFDYDDARAWWEAIGLGRQREVVKMLVNVTFHGIGRGKRVPITDRVTITPKDRPEPSEPQPIAA